MYTSIELVCTNFNLNINNPDIIDRLYADFRKLFFSVERKWNSLDGIPHIAKLFCFPNLLDIFKIYDDATKKIINNNKQQLFINKFLDNLVVEQKLLKLYKLTIMIVG